MKPSVYVRFLFLASLVFAGTLDGQYYKEEIDHKLSISKMKARADHAMKAGDMYSALFYYEVIVEKDTSDIANLFELGELYRQCRNYKMAEKTYALVYAKDPIKYPYSLYFMASMQKMQGKYEVAKVNYLKFKKDVGTIDDKSFKLLLNREIAGCDSGMVYKEFVDNIQLYNVGKSVNNPHAEFSPLLLDSTTMLYGSLRLDSVRYYDAREEHFEPVPTRQIYIAKKNPDSSWTSKGHFETLNHPEAQMGNFVYSPNTNRYYFTKCSREGHTTVTCKIYFTEKQNGKWTHPVLLPHPVNIPGHTSTQPAIVFDTANATIASPAQNRPTGRNNSRPPSRNTVQPTPKKVEGPKTEYLYFVSDRPGGKGGLDIWYTYYNKARNIWADPVNISAINTSEIECTPYFHVPTQTLYFSSNGHVSSGGLDVYFTKRDSTRRYSAPKNLGFPINSPQDELGFTLGEKDKFGLLVSNRPGGTPFFHETCCDDIFAFDVLPEKPFTCTLDLTVTAPDTFRCGSRLLRVRKVNLAARTSSIDTVRLTACNFKMTLEKNHKYSFLLDSMKGYEKDTLHVETRDKSTSDTLKKSLVIRPIQIEKKIDTKPVEGKVFVLKDIQYEFNSFELTPLGKSTIDSILVPFLNEHPSDKLLITSHTDNQGSHNYNMTLSKARATKVAQYLESKGINKDRLEHKGMGETKPIAPNENPDGSDNPIGRSFNRRTEFLIIKPN
ncbi:MAG: OmpA family protein [Cytophagaceae bacterium]|jgi:outer membrane protein OmpA-like peptidoglycan-associated protein|nr:OmpA family protein [Cytophagaceae bacterium]